MYIKKTPLVLPSFLPVMCLLCAGHQGKQGHQAVCNSANLGATMDKNLHTKKFCCHSLF